MDTLTLARKLVKGVENYSLKTLLNYFHIDHDNAHRSIGDCKSTMKLFEEIRKISKSKEKKLKKNKNVVK
jgi:DNA polymerase III epsilon subunit-like protein